MILAASEDSGPWWQRSGFRALFVTLYGIWLPFIHAWLEAQIGLAMAIATEASVTAILAFFGINVITRQAEARGRRQARTRRAA